MSDHYNNGEKTAVILDGAVFAGLKKQHDARARARAYFRALRRAAVERRLVMDVLNRDRTP